MEKLQQAKEAFLKNIDTVGLSSDERLVLASQGFDKAALLGGEIVAGEIAPDAPEGHIVRVKTYVVPDYSSMDKKALNKQLDVISKGVAQALKNQAHPGALIELFVRLEFIEETIKLVNGE